MRIYFQSNKGELETNDEILWTLAYNICLIETQAIVMSFFAAIISVALSLIRYNVCRIFLYYFLKYFNIYFIYQL